jgi:hypothetical protein
MTAVGMLLLVRESVLLPVCEGVSVLVTVLVKVPVDDEVLVPVGEEVDEGEALGEELRMTTHMCSCVKSPQQRPCTVRISAISYTYMQRPHVHLAYLLHSINGLLTTPCAIPLAVTAVRPRRHPDVVVVAECL